MIAYTAVVAGLLVLVPAGAQAQAVRLRYAPVPGTKLTRVFQTYTRMVVRLPAAGAGKVLETREMADLGGTSELVLPGPDGHPVVHVTVDSLRTRERTEGGAWSESRAALDSVWFQLDFDARLRLRRANRADRVPEAGALMHLMTGLPGLILPERPLRVGERWSVDMAMPLSAWVMRPSSAEREPPLRGEATLTVDSVVARTRDTLAYLSVEGTIGPDTPDIATASVYGGGVTGTLVWSTGWHAFVAAATRVRMHVAGPAPPTAGGPRPQVAIETTLRQQVRP